MGRSWQSNRAEYLVRERLAGDLLGLGVGMTFLVVAEFTAQRTGVSQQRLAAGEVGSAALWILLWIRARRRWRRRFTGAIDLPPEGLRTVAQCGLVVRSQAEARIAESLREAGVRFAYERRLVAGDMSSRVPDFTIWDQFGSVWYLEHLGMLRSDEYRERWMASQRWYDRHFPGRLLVTVPGDLEHQIEAVVGAVLGDARPIDQS